jgi:hypothetical protein
MGSWCFSIPRLRLSWLRMFATRLPFVRLWLLRWLTSLLSLVGGGFSRRWPSGLLAFWLCWSLALWSAGVSVATLFGGGDGLYGRPLTRQGRLRRRAPPDRFATLDTRASAALVRPLTGQAGACPSLCPPPPPNLIAGIGLVASVIKCCPLAPPMCAATAEPHRWGRLSRLWAAGPCPPPLPPPPLSPPPPPNLVGGVGFLASGCLPLAREPCRGEAKWLDLEVLRGAGRCRERTVRDMVDVANGPLRTLSVPGGPFATWLVSRTGLSRHAAIAVGASRPPAKRAAPSRQCHTTNPERLPNPTAKVHPALGCPGCGMPPDGVTTAPWSG